MSTAELKHPDTLPEKKSLEQKIVTAIKRVFDPEIPVDIYELGLIYNIKITKSDGEVDMTLTAPGCPVAEDMPLWVQDAVLSVEEIERVKVNMVFEPPWDPSRMSDEARLALGML
jgi:FeS assembly SUF system protein